MSVCVDARLVTGVHTIDAGLIDFHHSNAVRGGNYGLLKGPVRLSTCHLTCGTAGSCCLERSITIEYAICRTFFYNP